ncbi:DUF411 domain-containing protein [Caenimonas sp. SL110]|uniref:DUF411 domain-containing protein n=1 Tax=Caenimonas sp. SL110 TaxID=1450524 RepID=UPI000653123B|nr:DUF411 domain-containing protein [Caenimonas sp. SL110]
MKRRNLLSLAAALAATAALPSLAQSSLAKPSLPQVDVYKNPECGCCGAWVDHLKASGFVVKVHETADTAPVRKRHGIPDALGSCHTAVVGGYGVEGHVPAADIKRLLLEKPSAAGLSVPGMPVGSPGMEVGSRKDAYQVLLVDKAGRTRVFSSYAKS